ncbi:MAG TPA: hypothetical protein VJI98_01115 [Candidatus Nanoarchaeia archaeon]|nr:hypothetical protein [Candidatus Nanoarchaeia archaeon]
MGLEYHLSNGGIFAPSTENYEPLKSGILVKTNLRKELEPTLKERAFKAVSFLTIPLAAAGIAYSGNALANNQAAENPQPAYNLLVGSMTSINHDYKDRDTVGNLDSWFILDGRNGERLIAHSNNDITNANNHSLALGISTGTVVEDHLQLRLVTESINMTDFAYTLMLELFPTEDLILRQGFMQNEEGYLGDSVGITYKNRFLSVEGDTWINPNESTAGLAAAGYTAGVIPVSNFEIYLSLGGNTAAEQANIIAGLINEEGLGISTRTTLDYRNNQFKGEIRFAPNKSAMDRGFFDFQAHLHNGTEIPNSRLFDTVAPPDGKSVQPGGVLIVGKYDRGRDEEGSSVTVNYRALENLIIAAGPSIRYDSAGFRQWLKEIEGVRNPKTREHRSIGYSALIFFEEPNTGLMAIAQVDHNVRRKKVNPSLFLGWNGSF